MGWRDAFRPLGSSTFRWYFAARTADTAAGTMGSLALVFAVLEVSDSPRALGVVLAAHSIPLVAFVLIGGALADAFGRTAIIQVGSVVAGLSQADNDRLDGGRHRDRLVGGRGHDTTCQ